MGDLSSISAQERFLLLLQLRLDVCQLDGQLILKNKSSTTEI
jgi:hypothetical protein